MIQYFKVRKILKKRDKILHLAKEGLLEMNFNDESKINDITVLQKDNYIDNDLKITDSGKIFLTLGGYLSKHNIKIIDNNLKRLFWIVAFLSLLFSFFTFHKSNNNFIIHHYIYIDSLDLKSKKNLIIIDSTINFNPIKKTH